ncbi:MAG: type II toxin-antitoxin system CcdA family antitoxin [Hyphomicrobium sp.]
MAEGKHGKTIVEVEIDTDLAARSAVEGVNLSATLEEALLRKQSIDQAQWRQENRAAVEAWNTLIDREGLWAERYRD